MAVDYDHSKNHHRLNGPQTALAMLFPERKPASLLDIGCGPGTWLRAAMEFGVPDVLGLDGADTPENELHVPAKAIRRQDLTERWNLGRKFDVALCLEVGEHLDASASDVLVASITDHTDTVYFSAACPGQYGQHHVNCQWPAYWQALFNKHGFTCRDEIRWKIWNDTRIDPWYRQNLFLAQRDSAGAGREPRINPVMHPSMPAMTTAGNENSTPPYIDTSFEAHVAQIEKGFMKTGWYLKTPFRALAKKIKRRSA